MSTEALPRSNVQVKQHTGDRLEEKDIRGIKEAESRRSGNHLDEWKKEREESLMSPKLGYWMRGSQTGKTKEEQV